MQLYAAASVPVLLALLLAGFCGLLLLEWLREKKRHVDWLYWIALAGFMAVYVGLTFLGRRRGSVRRVRLIPFYSLTRLMDPAETRSVQLIREVLLNIALYIPLGSLLRACLRRTAHPFQLTVLLGFVCTLLTEVLQYFLCLGLAETDDVIHNMLGLFIGILGFRIARETVKALKRQKNEAG